MILCTMDLSNLLLTVLRNRFGICHSAIAWLESYLRPRGMKVKVREDYSSVRETPFAVPQAVLGPTCI